MKHKERLQNPNRLGFGRLMAFKSSDIAAAWINVIVLNRLSFYASTALGVDVTTIGILLMASKIVDAFTDIFAGVLVDNTNTKWGKGRPYDLAIIGMTLCTILLFSASPSWSNFAKCAWIFMMYTFVFSIFSTLRQAAGSVYTIRHFSNNPVLLKKVASYGGIITMGASMIVSVVFPILMARIATSAAGWTRAVAVIMVPASLIGILRFLLCKEDPAVGAEEKSERVNLSEVLTLFKRNKYVWIYAAIMLSYNIITNLSVSSYYFHYIIGNLEAESLVGILSIVVLPIMLIFPVLMKKIGSMGKMIAAFAVLGIVGYIMMFFFGHYVGVTYAALIIGNLAGLPVAYYGVLFIMHICNYNEMLGMRRMEASSGILGNFASKAGASLGSLVTGLVLALGGFISTTDLAGTVQPESALTMIRFDYAIIPAVFMFVIMICALAFAKLEPQTEAFENEKQAKLDAANTAAEELRKDGKTVTE